MLLQYAQFPTNDRIQNFHSCRLTKVEFFAESDALKTIDIEKFSSISAIYRNKKKIQRVYSCSINT